MTPEEIMKLVTSKDGYIGHAMNIPHDRQDKTHELVLAWIIHINKKEAAFLV